jgi:hypothetical protein
VPIGQPIPVVDLENLITIRNTQANKLVSGMNGGEGAVC